MSTYQEVLHAAQALPAVERVQMIHVLWDTISPDDWQGPSDAWLAEINLRSEAIDREEMSLAPWGEVRERVRREVGLDD